MVEKLDTPSEEEREQVAAPPAADANVQTDDRRNIAEAFYQEAVARPDVREILRRLAKL